MKHSSSRPSTIVPAIDKMCLILDLIAESNYALTSAEISETLSLPRSSTHNILQSLLAKHLVFKDRYNRFHLGSHLLYWAGRYEQLNNVIQVFNEEIRHYPVLFQHTVTLSKLDSTEVIFLACHESSIPLGFTFHAGVRVPAAFSATGKAMLASLDDCELNDMFNNEMPPPLTRYSVTKFDELKEEINKIRDTGISLDNGQLREGMYCMGTCITDGEGRPIAGMAVSFIKQEYSQKKEKVGKALKALANNMSERLGIESLKE